MIIFEVDVFSVVSSYSMMDVHFTVSFFFPGGQVTLSNFLFILQCKFIIFSNMHLQNNNKRNNQPITNQLFSMELHSETHSSAFLHLPWVMPVSSRTGTSWD